MKHRDHDNICERCGAEFKTHLPTAGFCSNRCRQAAYRDRQRAKLLPGERRPVGRPRKQLPESCNGITNG